MSNQKKEFVPYTQGCLKRCKFFVAVPKVSGYGYDLKRMSMDEAPEELKQFSFNKKYTMSAFFEYVVDNFPAYKKANKVETALNNFKAKINIYNETVKERCTHDQHWVDEADKLRDSIIQWGIIPEYQQQIEELIEVCKTVGIDSASIDDALNTNSNKRGELLLKAKQYEIQLPEKVTVPTKELYAVANLPGYAKYGRYPAEIKEAVEEELENPAVEDTPQQDSEHTGVSIPQYNETPETVTYLPYDEWRKQQLDIRCAKICARPVYTYKYTGESHVTPPQYTQADFDKAPKTIKAIRWTQDITEVLRELRENILVLTALYYDEYLFTSGNKKERKLNRRTFQQTDRFNVVKKPDMRPAPCSRRWYQDLKGNWIEEINPNYEEELRAWKADYEEEENKTWNKPIEWLGK